MMRRSGRPAMCLCERMACKLAVNASSGTFCCGPPGVSGRRESLAPWWVNSVSLYTACEPVMSGPTQKDGEKADVLLRWIEDSLREDLVLSVAACIDA